MSIVLLWSDRGNDSDCQAPGFLCPWDSPGKKVGGGSDSIPQGIFPTQGLNPIPRTAGGFSTIWATGEALL